MIIDTHLHESKYSLDSHISLMEIITTAKEIGLDGICITDHESNQIKREASFLSKELDFPIIVGAEFLTFEGDITVFGLDELPSQMVSARELLHLVHEAGGTAISAHPFRNNNRGMEHSLRLFPELDGIETFNGSTDKEANLLAYETALDMGISLLGGSDAHFLHKVGTFATKMPEGIRTEQDFIEAIKTRQTEPVAFMDGRFKKIAEYIERKAVV